ncbi:F-box protein [Phanerochaete sordida]|uniref:F-box protein n=1 Tax=Phanerochaete sordida TaxID=48140 RepID=A0A9P3LA19_9APHY|nr:F-box protein [Phanerochaete sordida]
MGAVSAHTLPDDILMEIFEAAYQHSPNDRWCPLERNPMIASQVCRRWRQTAISRPHLWCCLHVSRSVELLALWLERSGTIPLHVIFRANEVGYDRHPDASDASPVTLWSLRYLQSLVVLLRHSSRWWHFELETSNISFLEAALETIGRTGLPTLRTLTIRHAGNAIDLPSPVTLPETPWLTKLSTYRIHGSIPPPSCIYHLRQLHLGHCIIFGYELLQLSRTAPNLRELTMEAVEAAVDAEESSLHAITFPVLQTLTFIAVAEWEDLLDRLDAPALETLVCSQCPIWADAASVVALSPQRTFPALRTLCLRHCACEWWGNDGHFFRKTPRVEHLDLTGCTTTYLGVVDGLATLDAAAELLPALRTLTVTDIKDKSFEILVQFLVQRERFGRRIEEVRFGKALYVLPEWRICLVDRLVKVTCLTEEEEEAVIPSEISEERTDGVAYW